MKKLLLIDNYDSFTYNLVQYFQTLGVDVLVKRNDEITVNEAQTLKPDYLVFSPGPGTVENRNDVGIGPELFKAFRGQVPILGVCLGHQMMGHILGGNILKIEPQHGKRWSMKVLSKTGLFKNFDDEFEGMRYHSMVVEPGSFDSTLAVTAVTADEHEHIMAFEKSDERLFGVQFHPESIGTKSGIAILENFLQA